MYLVNPTRVIVIYYTEIKLGTAVVIGVLTSGVSCWESTRFLIILFITTFYFYKISTVIGVGTLAIALADADHFVDKFCKYIDSMARGAPIILTMERCAFRNI